MSVTQELHAPTVRRMAREALTAVDASGDKVLGQRACMLLVNASDHFIQAWMREREEVPQCDPERLAHLMARIGFSGSNGRQG